MRNGRGVNYAPGDCLRRFRFFAAVTVLFAVLLSAGCGTGTDSAELPTDLVVSNAKADSSLAEPESSQTVASQSRADAEDEVFWSDASVTEMEEWGALERSRAEGADAKEQAEEFAENVSGLLDRLNQIREEAHQDEEV